MSGNATTNPTINQNTPFVLTTSGDLTQYGMNTLLEMEQQITAAQANITTLQSQGPAYLTTYIVVGPTMPGSTTATYTTPATTTCAQITIIGGGGPGGAGGGTAGGGGSGAALFSGWISLSGGAVLSLSAGGAGNNGLAGSESVISYTPANSTTSIFVATALGGLAGLSGANGGIGAAIQTGSTGSGAFYGANGSNGTNGTVLSNAWCSGFGGSSAYGSGGTGVTIATSNGNTTGFAGQFYGAGGAGGTGNGPGGSGGSGYIKIDLFGYV